MPARGKTFPILPKPRCVCTTSGTLTIMEIRHQIQLSVFLEVIPLQLDLSEIRYLIFSRNMRIVLSHDMLSQVWFGTKNQRRDLVSKFLILIGTYIICFRKRISGPWHVYFQLKSRCTSSSGLLDLVMHVLYIWK